MSLNVCGCEVLDSSGNATVEAEEALTEAAAKLA